MLAVYRTIMFALVALSLPLKAFSAELIQASAATLTQLNLHMTHSTAGISALVIFIIAYMFVMSEEISHLRKSKPVVLVAGVIWIIIAMISQGNGISKEVSVALNHNLLEYVHLFLFLLVAMTYVNAMEERNIFDALRVRLITKGFSYRQLFWVTGVLAFVISPIADNLTTALLMCAVVLAVGKESPRFIAIGCINIVVSANAGGAFSPFGDITTLMVWQVGHLKFLEFLDIFFPSVISYIIPAVCMHFAIPNAQPPMSTETVETKVGAKRIVVLFLCTIAGTVCLHHFLHLPPVIGMMTGLGVLMFFSYYLKTLEKQNPTEDHLTFKPFDIFNKIKLAEWDTLFFFYGVILSVGGLAVFGYLELASTTMYQQWGASLAEIHRATPANITVGVLSAIVDNIPVMFAVLTMNPAMSHGQWLLVTLTAGIGGSMLSIGSAAGVALMGQSRGYYTFFSHLKWTWAIALGYIAGIACHIWLNSHLF